MSVETPAPEQPAPEPTPTPETESVAQPEVDPAPDSSDAADTPAEPAPTEEPAPLTAEAVTFDIPEGYAYDEAMGAKFKAALIDPELGLDAAKASKLASSLAALHIEAQQQFSENLVRQAEETRAANLDALKADKDFGGAAFARNAAQARGVIEEYGGTDESIVDEAGKPVPGGPVKELLRHYGLDTHPLLVRMFHKIGAAMGEDTARHGGGGRTSDGPKDHAEILYPS